MNREDVPTERSLGLNLLIYPSDLKNASRVMKIATSLQDELRFVETHAVGIGAPGLSARERIADHTHIVRINGSGAPGNLGRLLRVLLWQPKVYAAYRKAAVSSVAAESLLVLPLAARLAKKTGAPLVYNPHELETETDTKRGLARLLARWIERRYIRQADLVSVVNRSIARWYTEAYAIQTPLVVMNVPVDDGTQPTLRSQLGLSSDDMLYVHSGSWGPGRNIPLIIDAFASRPNLHLLFLGSGALQETVNGAVRQFPNIHALPPVASNSVVGQMRDADVGLCLLETGNSLNMKLATPNKLFEALCANTPALTSDMIEARHILGELSGTWVLENPKDELGAALERITKADVAHFRSAWSESLVWDDQVKPLIDGYRRLVLGCRPADRPRF